MAPPARHRYGAIPAWLATTVAVVAFAVVATWLTSTTWDNISPTRQNVGHLTDFRDAVYYPVVALVEGANPYDPGAYFRSYPVGQEFPLYSPVHLVLHLPLAALGFSEARAVFFALNLGLMLVLAGVSLRLADYRAGPAAVFGLGTLLLLSGPGRSDLRNGEPTLVLVLACYLALAAARHRVGRSAAGLAVALAKPTFGVPLAIVLLARRRLRAVLIGGGVAVAVSLVVTIPLADAAGGLDNLYDSLRADADVTSRSPQSRLGTPLRVDAGNALARLTGLRPVEEVAVALGAGLLVLGGLAAWTLHRRDPDGDRTELAVTLACLLLLVPLFRVAYDLLLLTWPVLLLARRRPPDALWPPWLRIALLILLVFSMADPLSWSPVRDVVGRGDVVTELLGPTAIGLSLLAALLLACFAAFRPVRARTLVAS
jgi:hypothetical protein